MAIEVVWWDEPFEGDDNRSVELAGFGWAKHGGASAEAMTGRVAYPNLLHPMLFHRAGSFTSGAGQACVYPANVATPPKIFLQAAIRWDVLSG